MDFMIGLLYVIFRRNCRIFHDFLLNWKLIRIFLDNDEGFGWKFGRGSKLFVVSSVNLLSEHHFIGLFLLLRVSVWNDDHFVS